MTTGACQNILQLYIQIYKCTINKYKRSNLEMYYGCRLCQSITNHKGLGDFFVMFDLLVYGYN